MPTTVNVIGIDQPGNTRYGTAILLRPNEWFHLDFSAGIRFSTRIRIDGENRDKVDFTKSIVTQQRLEPAVELPADLHPLAIAPTERSYVSPGWSGWVRRTQTAQPWGTGPHPLASAPTERS